MESQPDSIVSIGYLNQKSVKWYGGKAAGLGVLTSLGIVTPGGFVIAPWATDTVIENRIINAYGRSEENPFYRPSKIIVRSSGLAEDGDTSSYAGQHLTVSDLMNTDVEGIIQAIADVRASGRDAAAYRKAKGEVEQGIAVIIQPQIEATQSGVLFTADPVTCDLSTMVCEFVTGSGDKLVSGEVNPDGGFEWKLGAKEPHIRTGIKMEAEWAIKTSVDTIIKHFRRPMDIEWVSQEGMLYIVQARPLTLSGDWRGQPIKGLAACKGVASGTVKWINDKDTDAIAMIRNTDLLFAHMTTPKMVPAMIEAAGFATAIGGRTCHAAIVARELNKPCVVGAGPIITIEEGANATVDGDKGVVVVNE